MSRILKILGMTMVLMALLVVSMGGTVLAADGDPKGNQGLECPFGEGICGDCVPNDYNYGGPH